jgi:hypothetical protein
VGQKRITTIECHMDGIKPYKYLSYNSRRKNV